MSTAAECAGTVTYLRQYIEELQAAGVPEARRAPLAWASYARVLFGSNEFLYID